MIHPDLWSVQYRGLLQESERMRGTESQGWTRHYSAGILH
jgi:hypothetical protein